MARGNPNPSPATRFKKGSAPTSGRPKGTRDRISSAFLTAFADDFEANGVAAIKKMREEDVSSYVRVAVALQPKEVEIKRPEDALSDSELVEAIQVLKAAIRAQAPEPEGPPPATVLQ